MKNVEFVVYVHAFAPCLEMGVSHQVFGVKSPFRLGLALESLACM